MLSESKRKEDLENKYYYYILMKKSQKKLHLSMDFNRLSEPRNVSVDFQYVFCACKCLCRVYPLESRELKG